MNAEFTVSDVAGLEEKAVENFAANAAAEFATKKGISQSSCEAIATQSVTTAVSFSEDAMTSAECRTIIAAVISLPEEQVNVTEQSSRRLRSGRRLAKVFDVKVAVTSTVQAKEVALSVVNPEDMVVAAKAMDITIARPTMTAPKLVVEVIYTITQESEEQTITAPSSSELSELGLIIGATGSITSVDTQVVSDTTAQAADQVFSVAVSCSMSTMAFSLLTFIMLAQI